MHPATPPCLTAEAAAAERALHGDPEVAPTALPADEQDVLVQREHREQEIEISSFTINGSSSGSKNSSGRRNSGSSSWGSNCPSQVYALRQASFKSHPTSEEVRRQRLKLNNLLRSEARGELLRQLRAEAERELRQQEELLHLQQHVEDAEVAQHRIRTVHGTVRDDRMRASLDNMDSRPLQQLINHPQAIYEAPEELKSGEYMVALRPEGRSCLLLLRNGRGFLFGKNGRPLLRVQCSSQAQVTIGAAGRESMSGSATLFSQLLQKRKDVHSLPLEKHRLMEELEKEVYSCIHPQEKQRLLLELSRQFDVALYGPAAEATGGAVMEPAGCHSFSRSADLRQVDKLSLGNQQPKEEERQLQQGRRVQQQQGLPLMYLPLGILSKGLTLLECILCPYTPANMEYFCRRYGEAEGAVESAQTVAAFAEGGTVGAEDPLWQVLFVVDVLFLGGLMLGHCEFECRHFFLKSRIDEAPGAFAPLQLLPFVDAAASELQCLFSGPFLYPPDGFYFQHKLAPHIGGTNPLAQSWRDERIARFPIDEKNEGQQHIDTFLLLLPNGEVQSSEGIVVGMVDPAEFGVEGMKEPCIRHFKVGDLDVQSCRFRWLERAERSRMELDVSRQPPRGPTATPPDRLHWGSSGDRSIKGDIPFLDIGDAAEAPVTLPATTQLTEAAVSGGKDSAKRHRRRPPRAVKDRAPDSYAKLADQWLRMQGIHPVTLDVLCSLCPP